jgi:adenylate cyclase
MSRRIGSEREVSHSTPLLQRNHARLLRQAAGKRPGEPITPEAWSAFWGATDTRRAHIRHRFLKLLPHGPRCGICSAPFGGPGRFLVWPFGYRPSRKNPNVCAACVELSPPGGMEMTIGVLFADVRGFTSRSETADPRQVSVDLRRFYAAAEEVLLPDAIIDKLIGDEVMALYLREFAGRDDIADLMLEHARRLLARLRRDGAEGTEIEVGIGLDYGEAFVGNIGQRAIYDFTAVGDVVNVASRLTSEAAAGEIVMSERVAGQLSAPAGERVMLQLKGKAAATCAYRVAAADRREVGSAA